MKQDVTDYLVDSFIDYEGKEHKIVACALTQTPADTDSTMVVGWMDNKDNIMYIDDDDYAEVCRIITVGISVCNPVDKFDLEKGKQNAFNKATHDPKCPAIYTKNKGIASKALVDAFLKHEVNYFKENPQWIIKGYNQKKEAYEAKQDLKRRWYELSDHERSIINLAKSENIDLIKCAEFINL